MLDGILGRLSTDAGGVRSGNYPRFSGKEGDGQGIVMKR